MLRWLLWVLLLPVLLPLRALQALFARLWPSTALEIRLAGPLADLAPTGWFGGGQSLLTLLLALQRVERDPRLSHVVVHIDDAQLGLGQAEELREALAKLRALGKQVIVQASTLGLAGYWVALGASRIVLCPVGSLEVAGVASEFTLLKGLMSKVGVDAKLAARGRYKSMREMFTEEHVSDSNREMLRSLVSALFEALQAHITETRRIPFEEVRSTLDQGPFSAHDALRFGLIDELSYGSDLLEKLKEQKGFRRVGAQALLKRTRRRWLPARARRIAVLEVQGNIRMGKDSVGVQGKRSTGGSSFVAAAERIAEDSSIRAVLLRVNSPGGSALASDLMWHALGKARKDRPLVVSMGDVAASGGYYVSAVRGASIVANATTLTGSIGVVGGKWEGVELLRKLGIQRELVAEGRNAAFHSPSVAWGEAELTKLQREIDHLYTDFVSKMAEGRGKTFEELDRVAQGRVWTGLQAQQCGLVDAQGGLIAALEQIRSALGLGPEQPLALVTAPRPSLRHSLQARFSPGRGVVPELAEAVYEASELSGERLWCRLPFNISFK